MSRLTDRLRGRYRRLDEADIERGTAIILEETDPRLRLVSGHRRKLRKPVVRSLAYTGGLVTRIPGPFEISRRAYGNDPQVNALFASADDIDTLFGRSRALQQFFRDHPGSDRVYVPLAMRREKKRIMGMTLSGDIVRRDVVRTAVNFSGHRLGVVLSGSEAELRRALVWRGIHNLAVTALENITRLKGATAALEQQRTLLQMKLRDIKAQHPGLEGLAEDAPGGEQQQALRHHLEDTARQLEAARTGLSTLADYLAQVCRVFNHPSRYLQVRPGSVRVDRMGIVPDDFSEGPGEEIRSATVTVGDQPPFEVVLATFGRAEMSDVDTADMLR